MDFLTKLISSYDDDDHALAEQTLALINYNGKIKISVQWNRGHVKLTTYDLDDRELVHTRIYTCETSTLNDIINHVQMCDLSIPSWLKFKLTPAVVQFIEKIKTTSLHLVIEPCSVCNNYTIQNFTNCRHFTCIYCIYNFNFKTCPKCVSMTREHLMGKTVLELRQIARAHSIGGCAGRRKHDLVEYLYQKLLMAERPALP